MLSFLRDERGRPNVRTRLLLYLVAVAVLGPVLLAIALGGHLGIFGYPL